MRSKRAGATRSRPSSPPGCIRSRTTGWWIIGEKGGLALVSLDQEETARAEPAAGADYEPHRVLEAKQTLARFARALEALPPAQREAFLMHEEAGMSIAGIALATGAGEEAAKSRLRYAMSKLKEALGDE